MTELVFPPRLGSADRLPCGAQLDALLEQVADGVPAADPVHQRGCPHCRAALAELRRLWAPVRRMAAEDVTAPPSLTQRVMERVAATAAHGWHAVVPDGLGITRIAAWVIAVIAKRAAAGVPGVVSVEGSATPPSAALPQSPHRPSRTRRAMAAGVGVAGRQVVVRLQVVAAPGVPLAALGERIRQQVATEVNARTGLSASAVDVEISDLAADGDG